MRWVDSIGGICRREFQQECAFLKFIIPFYFVDDKFGKKLITSALMSKADRGERNLNRDQIVKLTKFLNSSEKEYIALWPCDKVIEALNNDPIATQGIKKALTKIKN